MILRKRRRPKMGVRKPSQLRSLEHLRFVRSHECAVRGRYNTTFVRSLGPEQHECSGPIQAAHIRMGTDGGAGIKPSDNFTIPLCVEAHVEQGQIGEGAFEKRYGIDTHKIASELWRRSAARMKMERNNEG